MTLRILLVISMLAAVAPAAVKRDEFGGASEHTSSGGSSSSQNYQPGSSGSNQGNLYYYYYPVQDKGKEHAYQASSSNQFTSAVTPGNGNSASAGSESTGSAHTSALEPPTGSAGGQDLSYSAQDLSYSAQSLGQGLSGQGMADYNSQPGGGGGSSNYDQLSNIASQLQQYAFGSGSSGSSFNPSASGYGPSPTSYNSGNSYSSSGDASGTGYGAASGSSPSGSLFPATGNEGSNPYSGSGPVSGFGPGAPGYGGQPGQMPYGSQPGYGYQSHSYDAYPSASNQHASYEPPSTGYRRYGIGSAILPILALAGLSLLIPTVTSLSTAATGRKRRSTDAPIKDSGLGAYFDRIERYYSLYKTAVEREECMNRIICELGDALSNVRGKSTLFNIMEKFVPTWMGNKVGVLKNGALSPEYGKCKKYTCQ